MTTVLIVVGVYMAAMLAIGIIFTKKANSTEEYYLSGRSLPAPVLMFTFAATWIGASSTLGKAGLAYTSRRPSARSSRSSSLRPLPDG